MMGDQGYHDLQQQQQQQGDYDPGYNQHRKRPSHPGYSGPPVCRDYLRNVCARGSKCRFSHPDSIPEDHRDESEGCAMQDSFVFCHDFQNRQHDCTRPNCRFLHCTREEEEQFHATGYLPPHLRDQAVRKGIAPDMPTHYGTRPICKDHLKGDCHRATCKFRHVTPMQYDLEVGGSGESESKRRKFQSSGSGGSGGGEEVEMLKQENQILCQRLEELKKQVHDLTTTNDFLLEQNAQLRVKASVAASMPGPVVSLSCQPTVSMSLQPTSILSSEETPIRMSLQPITHLTTAGGEQAISMSAVVQQPTATITMATLDTGCTPATVSVQPVSCCLATPQELAAAQLQPVSAAGNVHVQETRLVTFPITSIRQAM